MSSDHDRAFDTEIDPDSERFDDEGGYLEANPDSLPEVLPGEEIDPDSLVILEEDEEEPASPA